MSVPFVVVSEGEGDPFEDDSRLPGIFGTGGLDLKLENWGPGKPIRGCAALGLSPARLLHPYTAAMLRRRSRRFLIVRYVELGVWMAVGTAVWTWTLGLREMPLDSDNNLLTWVLPVSAFRLTTT